MTSVAMHVDTMYSWAAKNIPGQPSNSLQIAWCNMTHDMMTTDT